MKREGFSKRELRQKAIGKSVFQLYGRIIDDACNEIGKRHSIEVPDKERIALKDAAEELIIQNYPGLGEYVYRNRFLKFFCEDAETIVFGVCSPFFRPDWGEKARSYVEKKFIKWGYKIPVKGLIHRHST